MRSTRVLAIRCLFASLAVSAVLAVSAPVEASPLELRIDLSKVGGSTRGNWNDIFPINGVTSGLIDYQTGAPTGVSIEGSGWQDFNGDDFATFPDVDWVQQPATKDGAGIQSRSTGSFVLSGLTGSAYRIEVVSARSLFNYQNTITVGGAIANRTFLGTPVQTPWNSTTDGLAAGNWLIWDNVAPVGGSITVINVTQETLGMINALRVLEEGSDVPEPATLLLLGSALLAGLRRRTRA